MKDNSFLAFKSIDDFEQFYYSLDIYNGWKLNSGKLNDRGKRIRERPYAKFLMQKFDSKKMFRKKISIAEAVSWFDSYLLLIKLFKIMRTKLNPEDFSKFEVYFEYEIKMSKRMRIDAILIFKKKILLLEFRLVNDFEKIRATWQKKKTELLIYKELMENYIDPSNKILTYAFISLYEFDNRVEVKKHVEYNNNQIEFLSKYIIDFMMG